MWRNPRNEPGVAQTTREEKRRKTRLWDSGSFTRGTSSHRRAWVLTLEAWLFMPGTQALPPGTWVFPPGVRVLSPGSRVLTRHWGLGSYSGALDSRAG